MIKKKDYGDIDGIDMVDRNPKIPKNAVTVQGWPKIEDIVQTSPILFRVK